MGVRDKIKARMDQLQEMMESNQHLEKQFEVDDHISTITKFWSVLSDEDKDYIHACRHALEYQSRWEIEE
jgi:TorA maturation chaperone TorD